VQDRRRPNDRVSGEGQFVEQIEDPGTDSAGLARRLEKDGFEMPHLLGDAQHLFRTQVPSVGKTGRLLPPNGDWLKTST
jgi:hypothetical protein